MNDKWKRRFKAFIYGMGLVSNPFPSFSPIKYGNGIEADWENVGKDIRKAIAKFEKEHKEIFSETSDV